MLWTEETNQPFLSFMAGQLKKSLLEIERFKSFKRKDSVLCSDIILSKELLFTNLGNFCVELKKFNMDLVQIYHKANILIAQTYGITGVPEKGYVIVTVNNVRYIVYFYKIESGWNIEKVEECL